VRRISISEHKKYFKFSILAAWTCSREKRCVRRVFLCVREAKISTFSPHHERRDGTFSTEKKFSHYYANVFLCLSIHFARRVASKENGELVCVLYFICRKWACLPYRLLFTWCACKNFTLAAHPVKHTSHFNKIALFFRPGTCKNVFLFITSWRVWKWNGD
jgi:hypothetical protein